MNIMSISFALDRDAQEMKDKEPVKGPLHREKRRRKETKDERKRERERGKIKE